MSSCGVSNPQTPQAFPFQFSNHSTQQSRSKPWTYSKHLLNSFVTSTPLPASYPLNKDADFQKPIVCITDQLWVLLILAKINGLQRCSVGLGKKPIKSVNFFPHMLLPAYGSSRVYILWAWITGWEKDFIFMLETPHRQTVLEGI